MFKKIALGGLMFSLLSLPLLAQTATPDAPAAPATARMGKGRAMQQYQAADPATRAQKMADRMTKQLGLDQATSKKVYDVALARAQKVDEIQKGSDDNRTKAKSLKANADDFKSKLQGILTPDQFTKFESMKGKVGKGKGNSTDGSDDKEDN